MSRTITGHKTVGIKLTAPSDNPVTVATGASVVTSGTYAIFGSAATTWSLTNFGTLEGGRFGVQLAGAGHVTNEAGASISGATAGISIAGVGIVDNHGAISGKSSGIQLTAGGTIDNAAGATISSNYAIEAGGRLDVTNAGTVSGEITLEVGTVDNLAGGYLTGGYGAIGSSGAVTLTNQGLVRGAFLAAGSTVDNSGIIQGYLGGAGSPGVIIFGTGGLVVNTGTIEGFRGGVSVGTDATIINSGLISDYRYGDYGVVIGAHSTLTNSGTVSSYARVYGGTVDNLAGGTIGLAYIAGRLASTVNNDAGASIGVVETLGNATVTNAGTISALLSRSGNITLTNAGTIIGTHGTAVQFAAGNDRLIVDPGAVFGGKVDGGTGSNLLELAKSTAPGHLRGLGTSFTNFATIELDARAHWSLAGPNTLENTSTLELKAQSRLAITGVVEANGTVTLGGQGIFEGYGTIGIDAHSVLNIDGRVNTHTISFLSGGSETLALDAGNAPSSEIAGFGASLGNGIDLMGEVATALDYHKIGSAHGALAIYGQNGLLGTLRFAGGNYQTSQFHFAVSGGNTVLSFG